MMRIANSSRFRPALEHLDERQLLSGGVSATLWNGVLAVQGTSPTVPIHVTVTGGWRRSGAPGMVIVDGAGSFPVSHVRQIMITGVTDEPVTVDRPRYRSGIAVHVSGIGGATEPSQPPTAAPTATSVAPVAVPAAPVAPPVVKSVTTSSSVLGTMSSMEQAIVDMTNQARLQNGLHGLQVNSQLVTAAQVHSRDMAQVNVMAHTLAGVALPTLQSRGEAVGYKYSWLGENIAFNFPDLTSLNTAWLNSPEHRANILDADFTEVGVGVAWNTVGQPYFTVEFGRPSSAG